MAKKITYSEPSNYIPKDIQKKNGVGEFAKEETSKEEEKKKKENEEVRKIFKGK